ncbi:hypothetical protein U1Q18_003839 [Sarracenia purpurea var. burkii]
MCTKAYGHDDFVPMVDKGVDATWHKALQNGNFTISKGTKYVPNCANCTSKIPNKYCSKLVEIDAYQLL